MDHIYLNVVSLNLLVWEQEVGGASEESERTVGRVAAAVGQSGEGEELAGICPGQAEDQPEEGGEPDLGGGGPLSEVW